MPPSPLPPAYVSGRRLLRKPILSPGIEPLEARIAPSTLATWIGTSGDWNDPANWDIGVVPNNSGPNTYSVSIDVLNAQTITVSTNITVDSVQSEESITLAGSAFTVSGGTPSVINGALTVSNGTLTATGASTSLIANGSTTLTGANLLALSGGTLSLPGLTSYDDPDVPFATHTFQASDAGSTLNLPNLASITANTQEGGYLDIITLAGGHVSLGALTQLISQSSIIGSQHGIRVNSSGAGSQMDLSALSSFVDQNGRFAGSSLTVANGGQVLSGALTQLRSVAVNFDNGILNTSQLADAIGSSFDVSGGTLSLPGLISYDDPDVPFATHLFRASNAGSVLSLPNLTSITANTQEGGYLDIIAQAGGHVNMGALTQLISPSSTSGGQHGIRVNSSGAGSQLDVSALVSFVDQHGRLAGSSLTVANGGQVLSGALAQLHTVAVNFNNGIFNTSQLTDATGSSFDVSGGTLSLPGLTSYDDPDVPFATHLFRASNAGSILSLPNLTSITANTEEAGYLDIVAQAGGHVNLGALTQLISPSSIIGGQHGIRVNSGGAGSQVDLSALPSFIDQNGRFAGSSLTVVSGGQVLSAALTQLHSVAVNFNNGILNTSQLTDATGSSFDVSGGTLSLPGLTGYDDPDVPFATHTFRASNAGSVLSLPNLTSITANTQEAGYLDIIAQAGGHVNLGALIQLISPSSIIGSQHGIRVNSGGAGSQVDLSALPSFIDQNGRVAGSSLTVVNGGQVLSAALTQLHSVIVNFDNGILNTSQLTDATGSSFDVSGGTLSLPGLISYDDPDAPFITHTFRASNAGSVLSLPNLTSITANTQEAGYLDIIAQAGGHVNLDALTQLISPSSPTGGQHGIRVNSGGAGSQVDLSALPSFIDQNGNAAGSSLTVTNSGSALLGSLANIQAIALSFEAALLLESGRSLRGSGSIQPGVVNGGTLEANISGTALRIDGPVSSTGTVNAAAGSTLDLNGALSLDGMGALASALTGTISLSGDLLGNTKNANQHAPLGNLQLDGAGTAAAPQRFEVMGADLADVPAGFSGNFAYGTITLGSNTYVKLIDNANNTTGAGAEAIYVDTLVVPAGTTLNLNGLHLYARVSQISGTIIAGDGAPVVFTDTDGDMVTVRLTKGTLAAADIVFEASGDGALVKKIDLTGIGAELNGAKLTISATPQMMNGSMQGDGKVSIGQIDASGFNLKEIKVDGDLFSLMAGSAGTGKAPGIKVLEADSLGLGAANFPGLTPTFDLPSGLKKLSVEGNISGVTIQTGGGGFGGIGKIIVGGSLFGTTLNTPGAIKSLRVEQNIDDTTLNLGARIKNLLVRGDITDSTVRAKGVLDNLIVEGSVVDSELSALGTATPKSAAKAIAIKKVQIGGNFMRSSLLVGYDQNGEPANADVSLGSVLIRGDFVAANIAAGAATGTNEFFGDENDILIDGGKAIIAKIAAVTIKGAVSGSATAGDNFGIVAEQIGKLKIGGETLLIDRGPRNDSTPILLGGTTDVAAREVGATP